MYVLGGVCLPNGYMSDLSNLPKRHNIPIHLDGARLWCVYLLCLYTIIFCNA